MCIRDRRFDLLLRTQSPYGYYFWSYPRSVDKISKKRKRYTLALVELLEKQYSSSKMVGGGMANGGRVGNMGGRQWKQKFLGKK